MSCEKKSQFLPVARLLARSAVFSFKMVDEDWHSTDLSVSRSGEEGHATVAHDLF